MSKLDLLLEKSKELLDVEVEKYVLPPQWQNEITVDKAVWLADKLNANKEIVLIGALLMDLKVGQTIKEKRDSTEHINLALEVAEKLLQEFDIEATDKEAIKHCIKEHHNVGEFSSIESEICANADCYKFLHPKGFFSSLIRLSVRFDDEDALNLFEYKIEEKHKTLSLQECKEELEEYYHFLKKIIKEARKG